MIQFLYSIYDEKVEAYTNPWYAPTNPAAIRTFTDLANDSNTQIGRHTLDYTLYQLGKWDDSNGTIEMFDHPVNLGKASEYVQTFDKPKLKEVV